MMSEAYLLYLGPMLLSLLLSLGIALYAWRRREAPGIGTFALLMADVALWSLNTGLLELSHTYAMALVWYKLRYLSLASVPTLILIFTLQYSRRGHHLTPGRVLLLFAVPLITQVVLWGRFELFVTSVTFRPEGPLMLIESDTTGPWFTVHLVYAQLSLLAGVILMLATAIQSKHTYRRQAIALLVGAAPAIVVSALLATFFAKSMAHFTPISFVVTGLIYAWALFRYQLLDLVPVAHSVLINTMDDGVLVLDSQRRIVEINPAAEALFGISAAEAIGKTPPPASEKHPALPDRFWDSAEGQMKISFGQGAAQRHFDLRISPLVDARGQPSGRLVVFRDISDLVGAMQQLEEQLDEIQALQAELREQAMRDPLTGLYNRRYLEETLERELARAQRDHYPVSLVMIDIDYFKQINDRYGHGAGDLVLQSLAGQLTRETRHGDIVCRFGGEEFLLVLPNSTKEVTFQRAEAWRQTFAAARVAFQGAGLQATLSMGLAAFPHDGASASQLITTADQRLYAAKAHGRNRVEAS